MLAAFVLALAPLPAHGGGYGIPPFERPPKLNEPPEARGPRTSGPVPVLPPSRPSGPPGPGGPQPPGPPGPPGSATPGPASPGSDLVDLTHWSHWWNRNGARWMQLRHHVHARGDTTPGGTSWYLGRGEGFLDASLAPTVEQLELVARPILNQALFENDDDLLTATLMALAKIGPGHSPDPKQEELWRTKIESFLRHPNQEVSETAALATGLYGAEESWPRLVDLVTDGEDVRRWLRGSVPERTRAFALHGAGLHARGDSSRRSRVVDLALSVLEEPRGASDDLHVAAVTVLGLCRLEGEDRADDEDLALERLMALSFPERSPAGGARIRAHAILAAARLVEIGDIATRNAVVDALVPCLAERADAEDMVVEAAILALGRLVRPTELPREAAAREALRDRVQRGSVLSKRFALMALARVAGRVGGHGAEETRAEIEAFFLRTLLRGEKGLRPWAALAAGVVGAEILPRDLEPSTALTRTLRKELARCRRPQDLGAYAIALALRRDVESVDALLKQLDRTSEPSARGHLVIALGLMGERRAIEAVRETLESATYRPELLWNASIGLALLGEKGVVGTLTARLGTAGSLATRAALASALGICGDRGAVEPLAAVVADREQSTGARAFACAALGLVCDRRMLPWNFPVSEGTHYLAVPPTLAGDLRGLLDIL